MTRSDSATLDVRLFLNTPELRNAWVRYRGASVYLRRYWRLDPRAHVAKPDVVACVDIASISMPEHMRHRGVFKSLVLLIAHTLREFNGQEQWIYAENVLEPLLAEYLRRQGWIEVAGPSFFHKVPTA